MRAPTVLRVCFDFPFHPMLVCLGIFAPSHERLTWKIGSRVGFSHAGMQLSGAPGANMTIER